MLEHLTEQLLDDIGGFDDPGARHAAAGRAVELSA